MQKPAPIITPEAVDPSQIDLRLAIGKPNEGPLKMTCPPRIHKTRIGQEDDRGSLAVYSDHLHCFGCGWHTTRRYASLAFLLGVWDGLGSENSLAVKEAVRRIKPRLPEFVTGKPAAVKKYVPPPVSPYDAEAFHQYLLYYRKDKLRELQETRGLSLESIERYKLGYTATHFSIPLFDLYGNIHAIRYRADEAVVDTSDRNYRKYEGTWGYNEPFLYSVPALRGVRFVPELVIVEGEFDVIAACQAGMLAITITNGAGQIARIPELLPPGLRVGRWVVAVDQDGAGEEAYRKLIHSPVLLDQEVVRARWYPGKDLTDYFVGGGKREEIWLDY